MPGTLDGLRVELRQKATRTAQRVAREWERELTRTSPVDTGEMRSQTRVVSRPTSQGAEIIAEVDTDYAQYVAEGTAPHLIEPRKPGGVLVFKIGNQTIFTARVHHPGTRPNPWWNNAYENVPNMIRRLWA